MVEVEVQPTKERIKKANIRLEEFVKVFVDREFNQYFIYPATAYSVGFITAEELDEYRGKLFYEITEDQLEALKERFTVEYTYIDELNDKKDFEEISSIDETGPKL